MKRQKNESELKSEFVKLLKRNKAVIIMGVIAIISTLALFIVYAVRNSQAKPENEPANNTTKVEAASPEKETTTSIYKYVEEDEKEDPVYSAPKEETGKEILAQDIVKEVEKSDKAYAGIDVSSFQGIIDWKKVKAAGIDFAIIRVGLRGYEYGNIKEDMYASYNLNGAQENGIKIGVYFASAAMNEVEAIEEAKWVASYIAKYKIAYPVAYDNETYNLKDSRTYGMTKAQRTDIAKAFLDYISDLGYKTLFYGYKNALSNEAHWNTKEIEKEYNIWLAHYPNSQYNSNVSTDYAGEINMWQYTDAGVVDGISQKVDLDISYMGNMMDYIQKDTSTATVASNTFYVTVDGNEVLFLKANEKITAKELVNMRTEPSSAKLTTVYGELLYGVVATRTGVGNNGWSQISYKDKTLYVKSSLITTTIPETTINADETVKQTTQAETTTQQFITPSTEATTETEAATTQSIVVLRKIDTTKSTYKIGEYLYNVEWEEKLVTPKEEVNLRSSLNSKATDNIVATVYNGDSITQKGKLVDLGWSIFEYNGQIVLGKTSLFTDATEE